MASSIDATKPITGNPTTQSVRDNFSAAKSEIEALQTGKADLASPTFTGTVTAPNLDVTTALTVDTINETTPAAGVTIDGLLIKDGAITGYAAISDITYETLDSNGDVGTGAGQLAIGNHTHATYIAATDVTYENLNTNGDVGTGSTQVAQGDHLHTGVYEPADAAIVKSDEAETITANWTFSGDQTFSGKITMNDEVAEGNKTLTQSAGSLTLDPAGGVVQELSLSQDVTSVTDSLADGEYLTLHILDGTDRTIDWSGAGIEWVGGTAPTLDTTAENIVELWKIGADLYGAYVGAAS